MAIKWEDFPTAPDQQASQPSNELDWDKFPSALETKINWEDFPSAPDSSQLSDKSQRFAQSTVENAADTVAGLNRANQAVLSGVDDVFNKVVLTAADAGLTDFAVFLRNKQDQFRSAAKTGGMRGESLAQFMQEAAQGYQPDPARDQEFLSKVAQGAGSLPAIIAGGVIPGAQAVTGGAMMGEQGYQEAITAAPEEQTAVQKERTAMRAFALNAGTTAASEALLGVPALLRSVAAAKEPAKDAVELIGRALWQGVKGVFREGAQEGIEQVGQNLIAKELYDPNRPVDQGVIDSILVGGVIGGPFSAAVEAGNEALKRTAAQVGPATEQAVSSSIEQPLEGGGEIALDSSQPAVTTTTEGGGQLAPTDLESALASEDLDAAESLLLNPSEAFQTPSDLIAAIALDEQPTQTEQIGETPIQSEALPTDGSNVETVVNSEPSQGVETVAEAGAVGPLFVSNNEGHAPIIDQWTPALNQSGITQDRVTLNPSSPNPMRVNWDTEGNPLLEINPEVTARLAPEALEAILHEELVHAEHINSIRGSWDKATGTFDQHLKAEMGKLIAEGRAIGLNIEASKIYGDPTFQEGFEVVRQLVQGRKAGTVTEAQVNPQNAPTIWKLLNDLLGKFKTLLANNPNSTIAEYVKNIEIALYGESDLQAPPSTPNSLAGSSVSNEANLANAPPGEAFPAPNPLNGSVAPAGAAPYGFPPSIVVPKGTVSWFNRTLNPYFWGGKEKIKLIGQGEKAFNDLSTALIKHEDTRAMLLGKLKNGYLNWLQATTSEQRKVALPEVMEYIRIRESRDGGKSASAALTEANTHLLTVSPAAQRLVDYLHTTARATGDTSEALGVMVNQGGKWRPLQNLKEMHWPRMFTRRTWEILSNPDAPANIDDAANLYAEMVSNGNASSIAEARSMLMSSSGDMKNGDFFANVEKARGLKLPDAYYDYSMEGYQGFLERYADRIAQIQAYGQSLGGKAKTAWDKARDATNDSRIKDYLDNLEQVVLRTTAKDPSGFMRMMQRVRSTATMFFLSAPFTATRNLMSSMANTAEQAGYRNLVKASSKAFVQAGGALAKTSLNFAKGDWTVAEPQMVGEYGKLGAVMRDVQAMMAWDSVQEASGEPLSKGDERLAKAVQIGLTLQGVTERLGRAINASAAYSWGLDARKAINANEKSLQSRQALAKLAEVGITGSKLTEWLAGDPARWDEFLRGAVRSKQYGYTATQAPVIFDNQTAKFFGQFMKWGAQRASDVSRNVIAPALGRDITLPSGATATVHDVAPLMRWLLASVLLGEGFALLRQFLTDKERKEPTVEEIQMTWNEDQKLGLQRGLTRLGSDIVMSGTFGLFGDLYGGMAEAINNPGKSKDLLNPPGVSIIAGLVDLFKAGANRITLATDNQDMQSLYDGLQRDILNYLAKNQPVVGQIKGTGQQIMKAALGENADNEILRLRKANADTALAKNLATRYVDEVGIDRKKNRGGSFIAGKYSEISTQISEQVSMGDAKQARELLEGFIARLEPQDRKQAIQSIKASVSARAPLRSVDLNTPAEIGAYFEWVKRRVPSQSERIKQAVMRYMITEKQVGL